MQGIKTIQGLAVLPGRARFGVVASRFGIGLVVYFVYGYRHSALGKRQEARRAA